MGEGNQKHFRKHTTDTPLQNTCMNAINQALGKAFSVYYILRNKEPCSASGNPTNKMKIKH